MNPVFDSPQLLQTLPLQIADRMAATIVAGDFAPGGRLLETELAEQFGVSRATVREALRHLEQKGLVTILPQRGARVTQLSAKELDDLFEVRASLLATGSRLAARHCTPALAKTMRAQFARLKTTADDLTAYAEASAELVNLIMDMSGNAVLAAYIREFAQRTGRYVRLGLLTRKRRDVSIAGWTTIVSAIARNDEAIAGEAHRELAMKNREAAMSEFKKTRSAAPAG